MKPSPILRTGLLAACLLPGVPVWAAEAAPTPAGPRIRSVEIREAIRAGLPRYQPPTADGDVKMTESGEAAEEKEGVLKLPKVTVEAKAMPPATAYDFLTPKGRLELALKRRPGLKIGNLLGLNNGIAMAMIEEDVQVEKFNALKDQVEKVSLDASPDTKELNRLLKETIVRPNTDWLKRRSDR